MSLNASSFVATLILVSVCGVLAMAANGVTETEVFRVLVNKANPIPDNWEDTVEIITVENYAGEPIQIEENTYAHFLLLRDELLDEDIQIELDSVYRSVEDQQELWDYFTEEYGEDYAIKYAAEPGYSEHHTGLAVDIFLVKDGKEIRNNEDMIADEEDFAVIHKLLPKYGFILRYPKGKEEITGYAYEPWHIRYIGCQEAAMDIAEQGLTYEEYLEESEAKMLEAKAS